MSVSNLSNIFLVKYGDITARIFKGAGQLIMTLIIGIGIILGVGLYFINKTISREIANHAWSPPTEVYRESPWAEGMEPWNRWGTKDE